MSAIDELREARLDLLRAQTRHSNFEGDYAELKVAELRREHNVAANSAPEDNILTFAGEITDQTAYKAIQTLGIFHRRDPKCDITILLTSPGGSGYAGFGMYDYINELRELGHKVTIKVLGYAMSMAVTLLQAADERVMAKNAFLLVHEAALDPGFGSYADQKDRLAHTKRLQDKVFASLATRSTLTLATIKRRAHKNDWLIDAEEALKLGLVDRLS